MRKGFGSVLPWLQALWLAVLPCLHAADPGVGEWTMFGNGPGHSGFYPKTIGSGTFTQAWSKSFSTAINQVVIRADTIYGTTNGYFSNPMSAFALNAADGTVKWTYPLPEAYSVNPPAYSDGRLYFQRCNNSGDTHLWCLDAATGRFLWAALHEAQWGRYLAPTIAGGGVFVNGGEYGGMYGFDATTGTQRFFASLGQEDGWTPAYADGVVYTCVNGNFTAHSKTTGSQLWTRDLKKSSTGSGYDNSWYDGNVPVISNGKAAVIGGNRIVVVDINSRTQLWSLAGSYIGVPAMAGGVVYASLGSEVKAYDAATGALLGTYTGTSTLTGQPLVTNDLVITSGASATFIFNRSTFALQQTLPAGGTLSYASGLLCVSKGNIFGTSSGTLIAYRVQPAEEDPAPSPLPPAGSFAWSRIKGIYTAIFGLETDRKVNNSGLLQITLGSRGRFTGVVRIGAQIVPISDSFASDGSADISVKLAGNSYTLKLVLEMNGQQPVLGGTLETRKWSAGLAGSRGWKQRNGRSPQAGRYTVILNDTSGYIRDTVPPIPAVGTLQVSKYGSAKLVLLFANGERASFGGQINEDGTYPIFVITHGGQGHVQGMVSLDGIPSGTLHWIKPLQLKAQLYPLDISTDLDFSASRYQWRTPMLDVAFTWPQANCVATYTGGDLYETTGQAAYLNRKNRLFFSQDDKNTVLRFDPETGLVSGSFVHPRTGLTSPFTAILFQEANSAFGYFQGLRSCGIFYFGPQEETGGNSAGVEGSFSGSGVIINSLGSAEN